MEYGTVGLYVDPGVGDNDMSYPFPGMNPWLEDVRLWRDVHTSVITTIRDILAPLLEPRYFIGVETHTYVSASPDSPPGIRYPDITILDRGGRAVAIAPTAATAMPLEIQLPYHESIEEPYLEIRLVPGGDVVTVIELLSHTNKQRGRDRKSYRKKRRLFLDADVNFVEIDLLRSWRPMPDLERYGPSDYRIFIQRKETPEKAYLYLFNVRDAIPAFLLPLLPDDEEPVVALGDVLQNVYERARYRLILDYSQPPDPPLSAADMAWAMQCLTTNGREEGEHLPM
jgi:hypothetical protein